MKGFGRLRETSLRAVQVGQGPQQQHLTVAVAHAPRGPQAEIHGLAPVLAVRAELEEGCQVEGQPPGRLVQAGPLKSATVATRNPVRRPAGGPTPSAAWSPGRGPAPPYGPGSGPSRARRAAAAPWPGGCGRESPGRRRRCPAADLPRRPGARRRRAWSDHASRTSPGRSRRAPAPAAGPPRPVTPAAGRRARRGRRRPPTGRSRARTARRGAHSRRSRSESAR